MATAANTRSGPLLPGAGEALLGLGVLGLVLVMALPLPPPVLDTLLAGSLSFAILLFLGVLYVEKPVDFSVFPVLLLVATVLRLALNVASTRLILLGGAEGSAAAGRVIEAFGQFVVGGNYAVGIVVFSILVLINFVVVTKGAGRVAEVGARFTLDAMPGKQMAVDAELNAGLIDESKARIRRQEIAREADFYGAMDGASKFIRGDAIAGLLITVINIVGGVFIGVVQTGMPLEEALRIYTVLTIGDGLVGQIPALVVSTAAGLLVTRVQDADTEASRPLHAQISSQLFGSPRVLGLLAVALSTFVLIPGLRLPFATLAGLVALAAWRSSRRPEPTPARPPEQPRKRETRPEDLLSVDPLAIEVGVDLLYLVDDRKGGELVGRIQRIRNQFAKDLGVVLPVVRLRDNLSLDAGGYRVLLRGERIAEGKVFARKQLALQTGASKARLKGIRTTDPVFGLPGFWIDDKQVLDAQVKGFTVVDVPTVVTTHFVELMHEHAAALYDGVQLQRTLERIQSRNPRLVEDLLPDRLPRHVLLRVLRNLISEGLSTRDMDTILEALSEAVSRTKDANMLTELVREKMKRHITERFSVQGRIPAVRFGPRADRALRGALTAREGHTAELHLKPEHERELLIRIKQAVHGYSGEGQAVLLAGPVMRGALRRLIRPWLPRVPVLSLKEIVLSSATPDYVGIVELPGPESAAGKASSDADADRLS